MKTDTVKSIVWNGWETSINSLKENGWILYEKRIIKRNNFKILKCIGHYVYLKHNDHYMIGRFFVPIEDYNDQSNKVYNLDFMLNSKQIIGKTKQVTLSFLAALTKDDIPFLYETIVELQQKYKKPERKPLPMAEIIEMVEKSRKVCA